LVVISGVGNLLKISQKLRESKEGSKMGFHDRWNKQTMVKHVYLECNGNGNCKHIITHFGSLLYDNLLNLQKLKKQHY